MAFLVACSSGTSNGAVDAGKAASTPDSGPAPDPGIDRDGASHLDSGKSSQDSPSSEGAASTGDGGGPKYGQNGPIPYKTSTAKVESG
jgi:hypothetical protein